MDYEKILMSVNPNTIDETVRNICTTLGGKVCLSANRSVYWKW